jgi:UDP-glucose 4-epimerase
MRVLVTGGSGFIGRALVRRLLADGDDVVVADLVPHPDPTVPQVVGDLRDPAVRGQAIDRAADAVVHLAARTSVLESVKDPVGVYEVNVAMTAALLEAARLAGVGRFVLASTNAVVGSGAGDGPLDEHSPLRPLTPYGATKAAAEMLLSAYAGSYGMAAAAVRLTNVYGPGMERKDSIVARLFKAATSGAEFSVYGDGSQRRDYVFVDDAVAGILLACRAGVSGPLVVGSGTSTSVLELVAAVRAVTGASLPTRRVDAPSGEMRAVVVDIARARALGYRPATRLEEGLAATWRSFGTR